MNQHLAIALLGSAQSAFLQTIARTATDCGCHIGDSHMILLGQQPAWHLLATGSWDAIARFETALKKYADDANVTLALHRTQPREPSHNRIPYAVEALTADKPGIIDALATFFSHRAIDIYDMHTRAYTATQTGTRLFTIEMQLAVPADIAIASLREDFMALCERINLDAMIEPQHQ